LEPESRTMSRRSLTWSGAEGGSGRKGNQETRIAEAAVTRGRFGFDDADNFQADSLGTMEKPPPGLSGEFPDASVVAPAEGRDWRSA